MSNNLSQTRREIIAGRLAEGRSVIAGPLALEFDVSEDAIRRDLRALAAEGLCRRVYGGAVPITPAATPLSVRADEGQPSKLALARAGAGSIRAGEHVFLDSGSTNLAIVEALPDDADLTIVTNSPEIAARALGRGDVSVIMIGGMADPIVGGCVDAVAVQAVVQMRFDRAFIGTCAVSGDGISAFHHADASFKRIVITRSERIAVLASTEKLGQRAPHEVAALRRIDLLVVEAGITDAQRAALDAGGCVHLVTAEPA